jgi:hypothetical protein
MFEKLVKGRYLSFRDPKPKITYDDGAFITQPKIAMTIEQSVREKQMVPKWDAAKQEYVRDGGQMVDVRQKQRVSQLSAGTNQSKVHRNFQWLGYYGGAISQVPFDNLDVLSGNFSGCWMTVYKKDGITRICHVGTVDDPAHAKTRAAKDAWNAFANANPHSIQRGFNPARVWTHPDSRPAKIDGDGIPRIWGLVTCDELISIYLYRTEKDWDRYRIADLQVVSPSHMPELGNI